MKIKTILTFLFLFFALGSANATTLQKKHAHPQPNTHHIHKKISTQHTQASKQSKQNKQNLGKHPTHKKKSILARHHHSTHSAAPHLAARQDDVPQDSAAPLTNIPEYAMHTTVTANNPEQKNLVDFIYKTVSSARYSTYKLGGTLFDIARGVYIVDCSSFVDHVLQQVCPHAYSQLKSENGSSMPVSQTYYHFFTRLSEMHDAFWNKVENVSELQPGDILVFRYKNSVGKETGGHVMVVMDNPVHNSNVYFVKVADSASGAHSEDTRQPSDSGIGIGTLLLKTNPLTGKPSAYAWGIRSGWKKNVKFAMARPSDTLSNDYS